MQRQLVVAAFVGLLFLSGCTAGEPQATLVLDHRDRPPSPPATVINITDEDRQAYPVLDRLLAKWEAGNGTYAGVAEACAYRAGLELIQALQARHPEGHARRDAVPLRYGDDFFDLSAIRAVAD